MMMFFSCTGTLLVLLTLSVALPNADTSQQYSDLLSDLLQLRERIDAIANQQNGNNAATTDSADPNTASSKYDDLASAIRELTESIEALEAKQNELERNMDNHVKANNATTVDAAVAAKFQEPEDFEGSTYYFSKGGMIQIHEAIGLCEKLGGYLVEIQSNPEYDFIKKLIAKYSSEGFISVYIEGARVGNENNFKLQHSGDPVKFKIWGPQQPNNYGGNQNCMALFIDFDWKMDDDVCSSNDMYSRFICEVPVS